MRAMILAAGYGTRLGTLSDSCPKPLLPVCDVPILRYALALLKGHGFTEVAINLHHLGDLIEREIGDGAALGMRINYSRESEILGTGGGLVKLGNWLTYGGSTPFVVMNGKLIVDVNLGALVALHKRSAALATLALRQVEDPQKWGAIEVGDGGRITKILEHGASGTQVGMFAGVHVLSPEILARLPSEGASDSVRQAYIPALLEGGRLQASFYDGYFQEHSTPARYLEGNFAVLRGEAKLHFPPAPLVGIDETAQVDPTTKIVHPVRIAAGAVIGAHAHIGPNVVLGRNAQVAAQVKLRDVVAWPNTQLSTALDRAIVTPEGITQV